MSLVRNEVDVLDSSLLLCVHMVPNYFQLSFLLPLAFHCLLFFKPIVEPSPALGSIGDEEENWSLADGSAPRGSNCVLHISVQITVLSSLPAFLRLMKHLIALTKNDQLIKIKRGKIHKNKTKHFFLNPPLPHGHPYHLQHTSRRWGSKSF